MVKIITSMKKMQKLINRGNIYETKPRVFRYMRNNKLAYIYKGR